MEAATTTMPRIKILLVLWAILCILALVLACHPGRAMCMQPEVTSPHGGGHVAGSPPDDDPEPRDLPNLGVLPLIE